MLPGKVGRGLDEAHEVFEMNEPNSRIVIDKLLRESDWILFGDEGTANVNLEVQNEAGVADYVLKDSNDFPLTSLKRKTSCCLLSREKNRQEGMQSFSIVVLSFFQMASPIISGTQNREIRLSSACFHLNSN